MVGLFSLSVPFSQQVQSEALNTIMREALIHPLSVYSLGYRQRQQLPWVSSMFNLGGGNMVVSQSPACSSFKQALYGEGQARYTNELGTHK